MLAATTLETEFDPWVKDATLPVVWKKVYCGGRVFYTSLGHQPEVYDVSEALAILRRDIQWASRSEYEPTPNLPTPMYPSH